MPIVPGSRKCTTCRRSLDGLEAGVTLADNPYVRSPLRLTNRHTPLLRCLFFAALWFMTIGAANGLGAAPPMQIAIGNGIVRSDGTVYPVRVLKAGSPIIVLAPPATRLARLTVDGNVVQEAGDDYGIGLQPLGRSKASLKLSGLRPGAKVAIFCTGKAGALTVVDDLALLGTAELTGLITGCYYTFLVLVALFHILQCIATHDRTNLWYGGWVLSILSIDVVRDGYFGTGGFVFILFPITTTAIVTFSVAFVSSYLHLRREAKRLFYYVIILSAITLIVPIVAFPIAHNSNDLRIICAATGILSLFSAAVVRWRTGFRPAAPLAICLLCLATPFCIRSVCMFMNTPPVLTEWGIEAGTSVDFAGFTVAIALRQRYARRERQQLEAALQTSLYDANHDTLTNLLNRRGFDEWIRSSGEAVTTIFFIDLDGFKAINDRGGHAAGDDVLRIVSRIIARNVRECDAVARVGGDEFVIAFSGAQSAAEIADLHMRIDTAVSALEPLGSRDETRIGASIGIGVIGADRSVEQALRAADADAYRIKFERSARRRDVSTHAAQNARAIGVI